MDVAEQLARDSAARYAREVDALGDRLTAVELERDTLAARLAAVEALHRPEPKHGTWCEQDKEHWPCATHRAVRAAVRAEPSETTT